MKGTFFAAASIVALGLSAAAMAQTNTTSDPSGGTTGMQRSDCGPGTPGSNASNAESAGGSTKSTSNSPSSSDSTPPVASGGTTTAMASKDCGATGSSGSTEPQNSGTMK